MLAVACDLPRVRPYRPPTSRQVAPTTVICHGNPRVFQARVSVRAGSALGANGAATLPFTLVSKTANGIAVLEGWVCVQYVPAVRGTTHLA